MSIKQTFERLDHFSDYLDYRLDIMANNPNRWLKTGYYQLPTFEYYLDNCVNDNGGKYDFTQRRYKSHTQTLNPIRIEFEPRGKQLTRHYTYSMWMGTPFNFKEIIDEKH